MEVDSSLGKLLEEEKAKRENFSREVKNKREQWVRVEARLNNWEEELRVREKDIEERE